MAKLEVRSINVEDAPKCPACGVGWPTWDPAWDERCRGCDYVDEDLAAKRWAEDVALWRTEGAAK